MAERIWLSPINTGVCVCVCACVCVCVCMCECVCVLVGHGYAPIYNVCDILCLYYGF